MFVIMGHPPGKAGRRWGKETPIRINLVGVIFLSKNMWKNVKWCGILDLIRKRLER